MKKLGSFMKYTTVFIAGALFATATSIYAEDGLEPIRALLRTDLKIVADNKTVKLNNPAISFEGKTYLYLRDLETVFGAKVTWNGTAKQIEIKTNSVPSLPTEPSNPTSPTEVSYGVEGQAVYERVDLYFHLKSINRPTLSSTIINGKLVITYNGNKHTLERNQHYYYDPQNDKQYLTEQFLLAILPESDLAGLTRYTVIVATNTVKPI